ncbi:hypothetical protein GF406_27240 [candidate division KSB1 bacterium]|nr:hypothetical protein [candidate division KSB1 bacterium]
MIPLKQLYPRIRNAALLPVTCRTERSYDRKNIISEIECTPNVGVTFTPDRLT